MPHASRLATTAAIALIGVAVGVPPFIFGEAGIGKTTLAELVADALGIPFHFTGAVQKPHQLTGYTDASGRLVRTPFREAFENGGLFLFDEVDASAPQALLTVNAALSNGWQDFPDGRIRAHKDFRFIASANTNGTGASRTYSGRNQLDAASLDRFACFEMTADGAMTRRLISALDFPDPDARRLALEWANAVDDFREAMRELDLRGVISPRAAIMGARLIAAGVPYKQLADTLILNRFASQDDRDRLGSNARARTKARQEAERAAAPADATPADATPAA
jgi:MoxR-like ATPase